MLAVDANTFASPTWASLEIELDTLPVFAIVDEAGERSTQQVYVDPQAAEEACERARKSSGDDQLDTTPTGLGAAFRAAQEGTGFLVSAMDDVQAAGLDVASSEGKSVPMFVCMELASERIDGAGKEVPIFLCRGPKDPYCPKPNGIQGSLEVAGATLGHVHALRLVTRVQVV